MNRFAFFGAILAALIAISFATSCLQPCTVNAQCTDASCPNCMGGQCGAGCGGNCTNDRQCLDPNCRYCFNGVCGNSPQHTCGGTCQVDIDCSQDPQNPCLKCGPAGTCTAECGMACDTSDECKGNGVCKRCILGRCVKDNVQCGGQCTTNLDCDQTTYCSLCVAGQCSAGCGQPCTDSTQCLDSSCHYCHYTNGVGTCSQHPGTRSCNQTCFTNSDCTGSPGTCMQCYLGKCASVCQMACLQDGDCVTPGCNRCVNRKCVYN